MIKSANMATMPERINTAILTIESIIDQVDVIRLYLNNFDEIPEEFIHNKIEVYQGEDMRSSGKCFWALNKDEWYFTIDDDLIYPPTYVRDMLFKLCEHDDEVIVSLHGKVLRPKIHDKYPSYFGWLKENLHCLQSVKQDTFVHIIGNGCAVWNTNNIVINPFQFEHNYMDDITVSLQANQQGKRRLVMAHNKGYLKYMPPNGTTLHEEFGGNDSTQTKIINSIEWKL